jgi:hypothetical protein
MSKGIIKFLLMIGALFVVVIKKYVENSKLNYKENIIMRSNDSDVKNFAVKDGITMRDEIIDYAKCMDFDYGGKYPIGQIDIYDIVEKHIKTGSSYKECFFYF